VPQFFRKEILPGIFIIIAAILLTVMIFAINPPAMLKGANEVKVRFDSIAGLRENAAVWFAGVEKYKGIDIGKVKYIEIIKVESEGKNREKYQIQVTLELNSGIPLKKGTKFRIATKGLAGNPHVEVIPGPADNPEISLGKPIRGIDPPPDMFTTLQELSDQVKAVKLDELGPKIHNLVDNLVKSSENFTDTSADVKKIIADIREKEDIQKLLANVRIATQKSISLVDEAKTTVVDTRKLVNNFDQTLEENRANLKDSISNLQSVSAKLDKNLPETIGKINNLIDDITKFLEQNKQEIHEIMVNVKATTQNAKMFSQDIKLNPWKLLLKNKEKKPKDLLEPQLDKGPIIHDQPN